MSQITGTQITVISPPFLFGSSNVLYRGGGFLLAFFPTQEIYLLVLFDFI